MTFEQRERALAELPVRSCIAFAAVCSARAVAEAQRVGLWKERLPVYRLHEGVELLWKHADDEQADFSGLVQTVHKAATQIIPETVDDRPDPAVRFAAQAVGLGLIIFRFRARAGHYAAHSGGAMINLVGSVYEDLQTMQQKEERWQDRAVDLLAARGNQPATREMFESIPEYQRAEVSRDYLTGESW
jgi:hypothetical protein